MKVWSKRILASAVFAAVVSSFVYPPLALVCKPLLRIQPSFSLVFLLVLVATPVLGRFFCECLCPLGALQSFAGWIVNPRRGVRRVCTRLPVSRTQKVVRISVLCAFALMCALGYGAMAHMLTPYSILGKSLCLFAPGLAVLGVVAVSALISRGRFWCNWICPAGTLFHVLSLRSALSHKVESRCANCRMCFPNGGGCGAPEDDQGAKLTRRDTVRGVALLAAARTIEKTTDGGYADVSLASLPDRPKSVLPPGAVPRAEFNLKCAGCGLCVKACPTSCIRQSLSLKNFGQVELEFRHSYCRIACNYKCARVCPTGALIPRTEDKKMLHIGHAIWKKDLCVRNTKGDTCVACVRNCPVKALHVHDGAIVVDKDACIGCGACEHVCPSRPQSAIIVKGFDRQREVLPIGEGDLVLAMRDTVKAGFRCVLAKDGVIFDKSTDRGIKPLVDFYKSGKLKGAVVFDKVIGRAAAALCIEGGVRKVHAFVMSASAKALLKSHGVEAAADEIVDRIANRDKTGLCPMEKKVKDLVNPKEMVDVLI